MTPFLTILIEGGISAISHTIAGMQLSPLRFSKKKSICLWTIYILLFVISGFYIIPVVKESPLLPPIWFSFLYLGHIILYFFTTQGNFSRRLFMYVSYSVFFSATCGINEYFRTFIFSGDTIYNHLISIVFLAAMFYLLLFRFKPIVEQSAPYLKQEWIFLTLLMFLFFCLIVTYFIFPNTMDSFSFPQATTFLLVIIVLLSTLHIVFICLRNIILASHAKQSNLQLELISAQVEVQKKHITESRRMIHDVRHHNRMILTLAQSGSTESLINYLTEIDSIYSPETEMLWCENDIVNSIFTIYSQKALKENISCDLRASVDQDISVLSSDLVAIIGNLFENAIHGAMSSKKKNVKIRIFTKQNKLVFHVENDCMESIQYDEMPTSQYGVGLYSVITSLERYQGELSLKACNGTFKAIALLNICNTET